MAIATVGQVLQAPVAHAAGVQITNRKLTLMAGATDGGSLPGGVVNHLFNFNIHVDDNVGSIRFLYCTTASGTCTMPLGLVTTNATLGSENGATGFAIDTEDVNGSPYLTRTPSDTNSTNLAVAYQLNSITNPSAINQTFFVRITTHANTTGTGTALDEGTVAASTAREIELEGTMPESLIFCTGATVALDAGLPDCSDTTPGDVVFNQLFSPIDTATATSQMAASTNADNGYSITVNGTTLTSGLNTIPGMAVAATPTPGFSQFGMNLMTNTTDVSTVPVGSDITPISDGAQLRAQPAAGYGTVDSFKFVPGEVVARSDFNTPGPSNAQRYTAAYIVNVAGSQPAGIYATTLTYICTATY
ncbi:hypothetical protein JNJ66_06460 [Candidatus Saccharibacteria bacterium]|nr:hypothetical protein [Candidatus Saccharibacteria bacterium]